MGKSKKVHTSVPPIKRTLPSGPHCCSRTLVALLVFPQSNKPQAWPIVLDRWSPHKLQLMFRLLTGVGNHDTKLNKCNYLSLN